MTLHQSERVRLAERELSRRLRRSNVGRIFGFELEAAGPGRATLRMQVASKHKQVHRVVHGGILAALADTAAGMASYSMLPRGTRVATLEMKINFLEPVEQGTVIAEAHVLRKGRHFIVVDCDVRHRAGRLAAKALMTFAIGTRAGGR